MADFSRQASGNRFRFLGMKTNAVADSLPENKSPYAQNIRGYQDSSVQSRPQVVQQTAPPAVGAGPVLSLEPNLGVYKIGSALYVNGVQVDTGYEDGTGCSIVPFRPSASPNAYDYVFDDNKAAKVYVPSSGAVVAQKAGIAEPQTAPEMCVDQYNVFEFTGIAVNWTAAGTAGALSDQTRITDTCVALFADPASVAPSLSTRYSMQVGTVQYQTAETIVVTKSSGGTTPMVVQDVLPSISTQSSVFVQSIFYFAGVTGQCVIAVSQMPVDNSVPEFQGLNPVGESITNQALLSGLRRGTLVQVGTGANKEVVFVLSVTHGPQGTVAFECSTANTHVAGEALVGIPAISVSFIENPALFIGQNITATAIQSTIAAGTGLISKAIAAANNPFTHQPFVTNPDLPTAQQDDYVHFSSLVSDLTLLTEIRILFDVGDGTFTGNYFYAAIRPGDLTQAVAGTQTQLGGAQIAAQRQQIDTSISSSDVIPTINPTRTNRVPTSSVGSDINSSNQSTLGVSQYTEAMFPIRALTRVGNDQSKTLANCNAVRIQAQVTGNVTFQFGSIWVGSGAQPDVGDFGSLYFYRARPRNSTTGAVGNPSPSSRYGVNPRRQRVIVSLPSSAYDSQIDTWDIFRFGGVINDWKYVGSTPIGSGPYVDNTFDAAIIGNDSLTFDQLEPWPSIGPPIQTMTATVVGTVMEATFPLSTVAAGVSGFGTLSQLGNLLPGNLFIVGPQVFTLFNRPTLVSVTGTTQTYLFRFIENAGAQTNPLVICQEPALAAQGTNNAWGPDANGSMFSVAVGVAKNNGIPLRGGVVQWTQPNNPDAAPDSNTLDLCAPTEMLINGGLVGGVSIVFSSKRAWALYPKADGSGYRPVEIPVGRGIAADMAIWSDGQYLYYVANDSIRRTSGGGSQSLTDEDLFNVFPHEGKFPQNFTYAGQTVFPPEYKYASNFRLGGANSFLYFDYLDTTQTQRTLVCDLRKIAWSVDVGATPFTIHAGTTEPGNNGEAPATAVRNQQLFIGDTSGAIQVEQSSPVAGTGEIVVCVLATKEEMLGDLRAKKIFGDASLDLLAAGGALTATPIFLGIPFGTSTVLAGGQASRTDPPAPINLNGGQLQRSMGLLLQWSDQGQTTRIYDWQPSYINQPEDTANRFTDWDNAGSENAKFFQGFELECDTSNVQKSFIVRDADTLQVHPFSSDTGVNLVKHNGQSVKAYSFVTPFTAHLVRIEPQDNISWRLFGVKFEGQPTPESVITWQTQPSSLGNTGYMHLRHIMAAYASTAPVTLSITAFDGVSPADVVLPSTGGVYKKASFILSPNKGLLYTFKGVSAQPWQPFLLDWEADVKQWGSSGPYQTYRSIGGIHGNQARI